MQEFIRENFVFIFRLNNHNISYITEFQVKFDFFIHEKVFILKKK